MWSFYYIPNCFLIPIWFLAREHLELILEPFDARDPLDKDVENPQVTGDDEPD